MTSTVGKRFVPIGAFMGDHEGLNSLSMPSVLGTGTRNVTVNKLGSLTTIKGYTRQSPQFTSPIVSLHHYVQQRNDGTIARQLLAIYDDGVAQWDVLVSYDQGQSWTTLAQHGAASAGRQAIWTSFGNLLLLTNGVIPPMKWDGTSYTAVGDVQLGPPFAFDQGAGTLDGSYQYRIRPIRDDGTKLAASAASNIFQGSKRSAGVTWPVSPEANVVGYELYRTTGTGKVFFFEQYITGRLVLGANSSVDDQTIVQNASLDQHGDAPYVGTRTAFVHKGRVCYAGRDSQPRVMWIADAGFPESVYKDVNSIDFTDDNWSDLVLGGTGDFNRLAVIWQEWSVWTLSGTGQVTGLVVDFNRTRTNAAVGTVSVRAVVEVPQGARYFGPDGSLQQTSAATLAYLTPLRDIRLFDGSDSTIISNPKQDFLSHMSYGARRLSHAVHDRTRGEITWMFAAEFALIPNVALTWHYLSGAMYERDWPFATVIEVETEVDGTHLLAGNVNSVVYRLWDGFTFDDAPIPWKVTTKALYGAGGQNDRSGLTGEVLLSYQKRWRWADVLLAMTNATPVLAEWLEAEDDRVIGSQTFAVGLIPVTTSDGQPILSSDGVPITAPDWPNIPRVKFQDARGRYLHRRGMRLRLSGVVTDGFASVMGANLAYQLMMGLKRQLPGL